MRKLLTLLLFVLFSFYCNAQIEKPITKENCLIGGSFFGSIKFDNQETSDDSKSRNVYSVGFQIFL